jgi:hypothetical protein
MRNLVDEGELQRERRASVASREMGLRANRP